MTMLDPEVNEFIPDKERIQPGEPVLMRAYRIQLIPLTPILDERGRRTGWREEPMWEPEDGIVITLRYRVDRAPDRTAPLVSSHGRYIRNEIFHRAVKQERKLHETPAWRRFRLGHFELINEWQDVAR